MKKTAIDSIKLWLFPSVISVLSILIWYDVNQMRTDIKTLMAQMNIDKTRIDDMEKLVYPKVHSTVYYYPTNPINNTLPIFTNLLFLPGRVEELNRHKNIPKTSI